MAKNRPQIADNFQHRQAAFDWLIENGHRVGKATFYGHCKAGWPKVNSDGSVSRQDVIAYTRTLDKSTYAPVGIEAKKAELEIRKLELDVKKREIELRKDDDNWLDRTTAYAQMAAFFGTLVDSIEHHLLSGMNELIEEVDGNQALRERGYDVAESLMHRAVNEVLEGGKINRVLVKGTA